MIKQVVNFLIFIGLTCFASVAHSQDYSISANNVQHVSLKDIKSVFVNCYCRTATIKKDALENVLELKAEVTKDSIGYHGKQEIPTKIPNNLMQFKETRNGPVLKLESKEYIFMHHAYLIDQLIITVPKHVDVYLTKIHRQELDGRDIK